MDLLRAGGALARLSPEPGAPAGRGASGRLLAGVLLIALVGSACAGAGRGTRRPSEGPGGAQVGLASFYGRAFQGHHTASGQHFDARALTCAHRYHPFGAILRVTDLETGRSVLVKVTDRGPFVPNRIIDLSLAAARALMILERGVARVRVERVE